MSQVVLITGATSGMGLSTATYFAERGYTVYGTGRNPKSFTAKINFHLLPLDLNTPTTITDTVSYILNKHGCIDILINNAGAGITGAVEELPIEENKKILMTNLLGPIEVIKAVLPSMRAKKNGCIINVTSIAAYMGLPYRGAYSAAKSAFAMTSEALSIEVKKYNIKIINVAPGDFATDIAQRRYHTPVDENSPYREDYQNVLNAIDQAVDKGAHPDYIAKKIYEISLKKNPKMNYKIGAPLEKFSIVLKRILPSRIFEKMMIKYSQS